MKLKALSHYDGDMDKRFGDCILLYDNTTLIVFDCGHLRHSKEVQAFLQSNQSVKQIHIVISHNDSDHTDGIIDLLDYLKNKNYTSVFVYSSLYLKHAQKVLVTLDDDRRKESTTKQHILDTFDRIKNIIEKAQENSFKIVDAVIGTSVASAMIVGPTEDEFVEVVAQAIKDDTITKIEGETVMNAASVQLKCTLDDGQKILLCGDASPSYLHNLNDYDIIQLPHHGQLEDAQKIFNNLEDSYRKIFFVSDNTGSAENSGGSIKLKSYMQTERYKAALNTQNGVIEIPSVQSSTGNNNVNQTKGRTFYGDLDSI